MPTVGGDRRGPIEIVDLDCCEGEAADYHRHDDGNDRKLLDPVYSEGVRSCPRARAVSFLALRRIRRSKVPTSRCLSR